MLNSLFINTSRFDLNISHSRGLLWARGRKPESSDTGNILFSKFYARVWRERERKRRNVLHHFHSPIKNWNSSHLRNSESVGWSGCVRKWGEEVHLMGWVRVWGVEQVWWRRRTGELSVRENSWFNCHSECESTQSTQSWSRPAQVRSSNVTCSPIFTLQRVRLTKNHLFPPLNYQKIHINQPNSLNTLPTYHHCRTHPAPHFPSTNKKFKNFC